MLLRPVPQLFLQSFLQPVRQAALPVHPQSATRPDDRTESQPLKTAFQIHQSRYQPADVTGHRQQHVQSGTGDQSPGTGHADFDSMLPIQRPAAPSRALILRGTLLARWHHLFPVICWGFHFPPVPHHQASYS